MDKNLVLEMIAAILRCSMGKINRRLTHPLLLDYNRSFEEHLRSLTCEDKKNASWIAHQIIKIHQLWISSFSLFKNKDYDKLWLKLTQLELDLFHLGNLFKHNIARLSYINSHFHYFMLLFPYKWFASTELIVKKRICSICSQEVKPSNRCIHRKGKLYSSKICYHTIIDLDFIGVSLVRDPAHKNSVVNIDGKDYDYSLLNSANELILGRYEIWRVYYTDIYIDIVNFMNIQEDDPCLCDIDFSRSYSECCKNTPGIKGYQLELFISDNPKFQYRAVERNMVVDYQNLNVFV